MTLRMYHLLIPALTLCFFQASSPQPATAAEAEPTQCDQIVKAKCLSCHSETRICYRVKKGKSTRAWKKTVKYMIRNGAQVNDAELEQLTNCLSTPDKGLREYCGVKE